MAAGDKVQFPMFALNINLQTSIRGAGRDLPIIGTVAEAIDANTSRVIWPGGEEGEIPNSCLEKIYPLSEFGSEAAAAWGQDIGKYVQLVEWPVAGINATLNGAGVETPPRSPAASGIIQRVVGVNLLNNEGNEPVFVVAYIAVQNGLRHMYAIGSTATGFRKPYAVQDGRRAVGFN